MVVSCLIKTVCGRSSNLHELYSVLVSTFTGIIVIIFTELADYPILPLIYLTCLTDRLLIIHSRPITAYASTPSGLINHPSFKIGILLYKVHLVLQVRTVLLDNVTRAYLTQQTWHNLPHLCFRLSWCIMMPISQNFQCPTSLLFNVS
jgi:hypothetical protein